MNQKFLIWFCGTDHRANRMEVLNQAIADNKLGADDKCIVFGIGTQENRKDVSTMKERTLTQKAFDYFTSWLGGVSGDSVLGYTESHQLVSVYSTMWSLIARLEQCKPDQKIDLVIGGHSRGAAAGILGLLNSLCAAIQSDRQIDKSPLMKLARITLIPVDPVAGPFGNDVLADGAIDLASVLEGIENGLKKKPGFIRILSYNARFDPRPPFKLDPCWDKLLFGSAAKDAGFRSSHNVQSFRAGFAHSAMVSEPHQMTLLYKDQPQDTPMTLLSAIVNAALQGDDNPQLWDLVRKRAAKVQACECRCLAYLKRAREKKIPLDAADAGSFESDVYEASTIIPLDAKGLQDKLQELQTGRDLTHYGRIVADKSELNNL